MPLSTTFKTIASAALISIIFAGCSATRPEAVNNKSLGDNYLYSSLNKDYKIKEFSNQSNIGRGFIVNNYKPFGFNTSFKETSIASGCLWMKSGNVNSKYENIEANMNGSQVFMNLVLLPFTLPLGLMCENHHVFNYYSFNNDMKDLFPQSNAKKLVSDYDMLIETEHAKENKINLDIDIFNNKIDNLNNNLLTNLNKIKSNYLETNISKIQKNVHIIDKTGLYRNEKILVKLKIHKNNFPNPKLIQSFNHSKYSKIIDNNFPCNTISKCISNMKGSMFDLKNEYQQEEQLKQAQWHKKQNKYIKQLKEDIKEYTGLSKYYNVTNNLKKSTIEVKNKGITKKIFYTVDVKSNKLPLNQKLKSTVTVTKVNYSDVFPKYKNKDKNIEIVFSPQTKNYKLINNTNKFIQIKSISLYYDGDIYNLTLSKDNNVIATELSPQAINNIDLYDNIKESNYENLTKKQAKQKNFKFGFAIKYTLGEQTRNITLYNQHQHNLYSLIKGI